MGTELEGIPADSPDSHAVPVAPDGEEKPRRRQRKPTDSKLQSLPTTEAGLPTAEQVQRKLIDMVNSAALTEANRRRATAIDSPDYEKAFDLIAGPAKRDSAVIVIADVISAVGTGLIGYAINVYSGPPSERLNGHLAMFGGVVLFGAGTVLKYVVQWK